MTDKLARSSSRSAWGGWSPVKRSGRDGLCRRDLRKEAGEVVGEEADLQHPRIGRMQGEHRRERIPVGVLEAQKAMQGLEPCAHEPREPLSVSHVMDEAEHTIGRRSATEKARGIGRRCSMFIQPGLDGEEVGMGLVIERHWMEPVESGDLS
ncbi:hypothetical protein [Rhodobacter sp. CZR27]|uniref:hypothetical protein n=1 Tax=Rhodobacter sp. CZR27 TaxID=2033869 RepID=UPI0012FD6B96|nr:hypothetical protein [Rhodobacter sp. CZR27]